MEQKVYDLKKKKQIMKLLSQGFNTLEIAEQLNIHRVTVSRYKSYIKGKQGEKIIQARADRLDSLLNKTGKEASNFQAQEVKPKCPTKNKSVNQEKKQQTTI